MTLVVVGGGLAGGTAVTELRESGYDGEIVLFAGEEHLPYERPPLSKGYLLGNDPLDTVFVRDAAWYAERKVDVRTGTPVISLDPDAHQVHTAEGPLTYDRLLLATGASPRRFPMAEDAGIDVAYLRTIGDSDRLKAAFTDGAKIALVGAGWIGLEAAAAARLANSQVTVYESAELPLLRVLGPEVAQIFADLHRAHGVDLRLNTQVTLEDLRAADTVIAGIGVAPNVELAERAGLAVENGVLVDSTLRTSNPDIFAIGDIANHDHPRLGRRIRVEHWDTAIEQGKVAAHNLVGGSEVYDRLPYFFTDQYDLGMEYVGSVGPDGYDRVDIEGDTNVADGGAFRAYWVKDGTVVAAMHANDWDASDVIKEAVGGSR